MIRYGTSSSRPTPDEAWALEVERYMCLMRGQRWTWFWACWVRYVRGSDPQTAAEWCRCSPEMYRARLKAAYAWLESKTHEI